MDYSLPAWLGALAGTIAAVALYVSSIGMLERRIRERSGPLTLEQRAAFEERMSVMRRLVLGAAIAVLAVAGYWAGMAIGGR